MIEGSPEAWWDDQGALAGQARSVVEDVDLSREVDSPTGRRSIGQGLSFPALDLYIHGWDIARSAGCDLALPVDWVGYDSSRRPHAFVAMPFAGSFEDVFYYGISPPVRAAGLLCERLDQLSFTGDIMDRMKERIASSAIVVADLSDANPNVYLEVGYALDFRGYAAAASQARRMMWISWVSAGQGEMR